jgi:tripartite-type tricarboxylate transporter receptor subunit TctC
MVAGVAVESHHRRSLVLLPLAAALPRLLRASTSEPTSWPRRPIQITVAYPPGGVSDQIARMLADVMARQLGVAVVVQNRAGASGMLALDLLSRREPDGHHLCFVAATALALRARAARQHATTTRAPVAVAGVMRTPVLIVGTRSLRTRTFAQMIDMARARPGSVRWATTGEGTTGHAVLERVCAGSAAEIVHVPYKGGGQQLVDALAGHFEVLSTNVATAQLEDIAAGRFVALAVGSPERVKALPDVPTLSELGYPQANLDSLFGLFAPAGISRELADIENQAVATALKDPNLRGRLLRMNNVPFSGSAADFSRQVAREADR